MDLDYDIKHNFNLKGLSIGDSFLGCKKCWFRYDPHTGAMLECPKCRNPKMSLFNITKKDMLLIKENKNVSINKP